MLTADYRSHFNKSQELQHAGSVIWRSSLLIVAAGLPEASLKNFKISQASVWLLLSVCSNIKDQVTKVKSYFMPTHILLLCMFDPMRLKHTVCFIIGSHIRFKSLFPATSINMHLLFLSI